MPRLPACRVGAGSDTIGGMEPYPDLILASASPRRKELLEAAGLRVDVRPQDVDETPFADEDAVACALRLARSKADAVPEAAAPVLAADTVVTVDGRLLGKPADPDEAAAMLRALSGRPHAVVTAFALRFPDGTRHLQAVTTRVTFRDLTDVEIRRYVVTGEPMDKAGAYAIQGQGMALIDHVDGSWTNVVGLPLPEVLAAWRGHVL